MATTTTPSSSEAHAAAAAPQASSKLHGLLQTASSNKSALISRVEKLHANFETQLQKLADENARLKEHVSELKARRGRPKSSSSKDLPPLVPRKPRGPKKSAPAAAPEAADE